MANHEPDAHRRSKQLELFAGAQRRSIERFRSAMATRPASAIPPVCGTCGHSILGEMAVNGWGPAHLWCQDVPSDS